MPERIQRRRTPGWRMPADAIYVGRPSRFGNPFVYRTRLALARVPALDGSAWEYENRISGDGMQHDYHHPDGRITEHHVRYMTRAECVGIFRRALVNPTPWLHVSLGPGPRNWLTTDRVRRELAGRDLACWCPLVDHEGRPVPCHADVLLEICAEVEVAHA